MRIKIADKITSLGKTKSKGKKRRERRNLHTTRKNWKVKSLIKKKPPRKLTKYYWSNFHEWANKKETWANSDLFQKFFNYQRSRDMLKYLYRTNNKYKNNDLVNLIKRGLSDIKNEIGNMDEEEKEIEKPNEMIETVPESLEFNKQNEQGKRLKILKPYQMFSRLPICLAQLKAANNSQKPINEIMQLLYSLYRLKNWSKQYTTI